MYRVGSQYRRRSKILLPLVSHPPNFNLHQGALRIPAPHPILPPSRPASPTCICSRVLRRLRQLAPIPHAPPTLPSGMQHRNPAPKHRPPLPLHRLKRQRPNRRPPTLDFRNRDIHLLLLRLGQNMYRPTNRFPRSTRYPWPIEIGNRIRETAICAGLFSRCECVFEYRTATP